MSKYLVVIEPTDTGFSAYSPDLPGCVATAATEAELQAVMGEAIAFHVEGLRLEGLPVPAPSTRSAWVEVSTAA